MTAYLDVALVVAFVAYSAYSGLSARRVSSQNLEEYFLAGRTLPGWKAGLSMAATQFAADTPLLVTGMIATAGLFSLWRLWVYALAFLLMGFLLAAAWRRAGVLTDAELTEVRYGGQLAVVLRVAKALYFGTVFNCTVLAMVLFAATRIAEPFLLWHEWLPPGAFGQVVAFVDWSGLKLTAVSDPALENVRSANNLLSLLGVVAVTALYSTTGGLRAVVNTDLVQFVVAMVGTLAYAFVVVRQAGGLAALPGRLQELYGALRASELLAITPTRARDASWVVMGTMAIQWVAQMNADGTGYLAQRTMACRSDRDARQAAVIFTFAQVLFRSLLWIAIGLALLVLFPTALSSEPAFIAAREGTYVEGIVRYLPVGVKGLLLAGMLAALASTVDTHLNWGASYWTNDLYRRVLCQALLKQEPTGRALVWVARLSNLLLLVVAAFILTRLNSIQAAWNASLLLGAGMGLPLLLRWVWWRMTAAAELAAIAASTVLAPVLMATVDGDGVRLLLMALASVVVVFLVAGLGGGAHPQTLQTFYRRVRPPGFWGPVAAACGEAPAVAGRRLWGGLLFTAGCAGGLFCLLVGASTLLFGSPPPTWFPWRAAWAAGLLALGSAGLFFLWRNAPPAGPHPEGR